MLFGTFVSWYIHSHFTEKSEGVGENYFPALKMQFWSILLKYQEIDVQIQTFTDENWKILHSCFFERYYSPTKPKK